VADKHVGTHGNKYSDVNYKYKYKVVKICTLVLTTVQIPSITSLVHLYQS